MAFVIFVDVLNKSSESVVLVGSGRRMSRKAQRPSETTNARGLGKSHDTVPKSEDDQNMKTSYSIELRVLNVWVYGTSDGTGLLICVSASSTEAA